MAADLAIVVLAAGGATRMRGGDKLLELVGDEPLIRRQARIASEASDRVVVVMPPDRPLRVAALEGLAVRLVVARDAARGMAASLVCGIDAVGADVAGVMILPGDMPEFEAGDLRHLAEVFAGDPTRIVRGASAAGQPGHPAIFPADLFGELQGLAGDEGGRSVLARHAGRVVPVRLAGERAITDLDTPEDWAAWRARTGM